MSRPLSRRESQARTRRLLVDAAARVAAERGLEQASVAAVAGAAGFTKGAVYANFASKEELFLAALEERFAERMAQIDELATRDVAPEVAMREGGDDFARFLASDPDWQRLFFEFAAAALRDEALREALVERYRALREGLAATFQRRFDELGLELPLPADQVATLVFAMANGLALEGALEPDAVPPELHGRMLEIFAAGLRASSG